MYTIIMKATGNKLSCRFFVTENQCWKPSGTTVYPVEDKPFSAGYQKGEVMEEQKEKSWKEEMEQWQRKGDDPDTFIPVIRLSAVREKEVRYSSRKVTTVEKAAELARLLLDGADRECIVVCCMDTKMKPLSLERTAIGTVNECPLNMREVFKYAVISNAACLLVFHNHPSGEAEPSEEDIWMTRKMKKAGELMGIPVMDHIILGYEEYVSFAERFGWMKTKEAFGAAEGREFYGPPEAAEPCTGEIL